MVYGGVATWIVNFLEMFKNDDDFEIIPIYLAYNDKSQPEFFEKYPGLRVIDYQKDIDTVFQDIDICVNNIWIALDTIKYIKEKFPKISMVSVCHSLIQMEHITNLGSCYTNTWSDQEVTFKNSDFVVLISNAEKKYYNSFGYDKYKAIPIVIYNSYKPKFDNQQVFDNYDCNYPGYIGRHVPRKRPEIPILAVNRSKQEDIQVFNMGVDYKGGSNLYWEQLEKTFKENLEIIPFSTDKSKKNYYWNNVGVNCITGIYEPFGYTICETLDRRVPAIVQNIDGPSEIISQVKEHVFMYDVNKKDIDKDVDNFLEALEKFWNTEPEVRKKMAENARKALQRFTPEVIKQDWCDLLNKTDCYNISNLEPSKQNIFPYFIIGKNILLKIKKFMKKLHNKNA